MAKAIRLVAYIIVTKVEGGPNQEEDAIRDALVMALDDIGSVFAQDDQHDDETEYDINYTFVRPALATEKFGEGVVQALDPQSKVLS